MSTFLLLQDAGVHALSNVCHVDVQRISKRKPGEVVCNLSVMRKYAVHMDAQVRMSTLN